LESNVLPADHPGDRSAYDDLSAGDHSRNLALFADDYLSSAESWGLPTISPRGVAFFTQPRAGWWQSVRPLRLARRGYSRSFEGCSENKSGQAHSALIDALHHSEVNKDGLIMLSALVSHVQDIPAGADTLRRIPHFVAPSPSHVEASSPQRRAATSFANIALLTRTRPQLASSPSDGKNDWRYPAIWWRGADGVNLEAVELCFPPLAAIS
jgi:hypothetical protein